ncbi:MAG: beta-ketoacyl-ACP reductase [Actinobacteria bacterium HGW-Actinobacteria-8]|nr:MAG: beta-ketoacyl-ACP reductase [Actinobacteria bacterium HGW-Actinobacteria-8]
MGASASLGPMTRHVVVTGANRGIGRAIAEAFVVNGDTVSSIYRGGNLPDGVTGAIADITDTDAVNAAFDELEAQHGRVRVLVANAGITRDGLLMRMSDEDFAAVIDTNLTGTFRTVRRAVNSMMREKYGRIVLVGSVVGLLGNPGQVNYAASKSALVGMARSITREVGGRGITANVVAPGFIATDMTAELGDDAIKQYESSIPAKRFGTTQDVAAATVFLASDAAGYISGAVLPVDGGLGMGH